MPTDTLLARTKDNYVVVLKVTYNNDAEKTRLAAQCERYCSGVNLTEFNSSGLPATHVDFDVKNTEFLRDEITGYHCRKQSDKFVNGLRDNNFPPAVMKPNMLHFDSRLSDDFYPEMLKNIGYQVVPEDAVCQVRYRNGEFGLYVRRRNPVTGRDEEVPAGKRTMARVNWGENKLTVLRYHFQFDNAADYNRLRQLIADYKAAKTHNARLTLDEFENSIGNDKDRSLFGIYSFEQRNVEHLGSIVHHELKHVKNSIFLNGSGLKDDYKLMSAENMYRLCVENERSAYLAQLVYATGNYLKRGDSEDFSMFDNSCSFFAEKLKAMPADRRFAVASDMPSLVKGMLEEFKNSYQQHYDDNQFADNVTDMASRQPVFAPEDTDGEIFRRIRSLYYTYPVYNPATGREEFVNLAQYIDAADEVQITNAKQRKMISDAQKKIDEKRTKYRDMASRGEIEPSLAGSARQVMRGVWQNSAFVNEMDGLNIGTLLDDNSHNPVNPGRTHIPDDKADWSDDLEKYWSQVSGYRKIAKNNYEYSFSVNEAKLSYSDKNNVRVSPNADFEIYVKLLKEPTNKNLPVEFKDTLTAEQAKMLYVACINYGRRMTGHVPSDLSGLESLGIPQEELNKFHHRTGSACVANPRTNGNAQAAVSEVLRQNRARGGR